MPESSSTRRTFLRQTSIVGAGLLVPALSAQQKPSPDKDKAKGDEGVSPAEDLMREHGVLNRILLIYDEHLRMLAGKRPFDGSVLVSAADIIRHFVEEYHEKLEEDFLFPRFRKAGKLVNLVDTLQAQHKAGRELTATIQRTGRDRHAQVCVVRQRETGRRAARLSANVSSTRGSRRHGSVSGVPHDRFCSRIRCSRRRLREEGR